MKTTVYQDADTRWRWRLQSANGRVLADSGQSYASKREVLRAVYVLMEAADSGELTQAFEAPRVTP